MALSRKKWEIEFEHKFWKIQDKNNLCYQDIINFIQQVEDRARTEGYSKGHDQGYIEGLQSLKVSSEKLQEKTRSEERARIVREIEEVIQKMESYGNTSVRSWFEDIIELH